MAFKLAEAYVQLSSRGMGTVRRALGGIGRGLVSLLNPAAMVGAALAGIGTGVGIASMITLAAGAEKTAVAFEVLLGSAEKAKEMVIEINAFAARTPFEQGELAGVTKQLLAFGVAQKGVIPILSMLGDIAALSGAQINELASIYGKAKGTGIVMTEILDQFLERGIPLGRELAKVMGVAEKEIRKLAPTGKISFEILEKALGNLTGQGGQFFDGMRKLSQTTAGLWSTFTGNLKLSLGRLGNVLIETFDIKEMVRGMGQSMANFGESIEKIGPKLEGVAEDVKVLTDLVMSLGGVIRDTAAAWASFRTGTAQGTEDASVMRNIFDDISFTFRNWGDMIAIAMEHGLTAWRGFFASMENGWQTIGMLAAAAMDPANWGDLKAVGEGIVADMSAALGSQLKEIGDFSRQNIDAIQASINAREFARRTGGRIPDTGEDGTTAGAEDGAPSIPDTGKAKAGKFRITSLAGLADQMQSEAGKRIAERNATANERTAVATEQMAAEKAADGEKLKQRLTANLAGVSDILSMTTAIPAFQ